MNLPIALSAISLALCGFLFFYFRAYIRRYAAAENQLAECRAEVYRLIAQIDAATDRDSQLVEERIKSLKKILEDTDRRLAVYIQEQERSRRGEALYTNLGRGVRAALSIEPPVQAAQGEALPPAGSSSAKTAPRQKRAAAGQVLPQQPGLKPGLKPGKKTGRKQKAGSSPQPQPAPKPLKTQIAELSAQGLPPEKIASRLNISLSEVDLALNLLSGFTG